MHDSLVMRSSAHSLGRNIGWEFKGLELKRRMASNTER